MVVLRTWLRISEAGLCAIVDLNLFIIHIMKNFIPFFLVVLVAVSCVQRSKYEHVVSQRDSLEIASAAQSQQMTELQSYISEISNSLDSISIQESVLFLPDPELNNKPLTKKEMVQRLECFQELIGRQCEKINELEQIIAADSLELSSLHSIVTFLSDQIKEKDKSISKLKAELQSSRAQVRKLNSKIDTLNSHISMLSENISGLESLNESQTLALNAQDMLLNEAYVCIGDRRELARNGVKFGVKMNYASINREFLQVVDIRDFRSIRINSPKVKLLTPMPKESYTLTPDGDQTILDIVAPGVFWSNSNLLIIQTDVILSAKQR